VLLLEHFRADLRAPRPQSGRPGYVKQVPLGSWRVSLFQAIPISRESRLGTGQPPDGTNARTVPHTKPPQSCGASIPIVAVKLLAASVVPEDNNVRVNPVHVPMPFVRLYYPSIAHYTTIREHSDARVIGG
jgi:hypothetical protein